MHSCCCTERIRILLAIRSALIDLIVLLLNAALIDIFVVIILFALEKGKS
jgi:hypothetical protein